MHTKANPEPNNRVSPRSNIEELIGRAVARYAAMTPEQRDAVHATQRSGYGRDNRTDAQLLADWRMCSDVIRDATEWGAAYGAALGFIADCERRMRLREILIPDDTGEPT